MAARFRAVLLVMVALALFPSAPAEAVRIGPDSILECLDAGDDCFTDSSEANLLDFDGDLVSGDSVLLDITLDPEDDQPQIAFSAFPINSSPIDWMIFASPSSVDRPSRSPAISCPKRALPSSR